MGLPQGTVISRNIKSILMALISEHLVMNLIELIHSKFTGGVVVSCNVLLLAGIFGSQSLLVAQTEVDRHVVGELSLPTLCDVRIDVVRLHLVLNQVAYGELFLQIVCVPWKLLGLAHGVEARIRRRSLAEDLDHVSVRAESCLRSQAVALLRGELAVL